jgi:hypothetical protein
MLSTTSLRAAIRIGFCICLVGSPAAAAEMSPWFGSADQQPFQIETTGEVDVSHNTDLMQTGSLCPSKTCAEPTNTAKRDAVGGDAPQN